ncbi:MAG: VCBS repeat-containing protein [Lysobacter sp.]|nr:VCBS repeat-containing protein [Lysobacter sp.]
MTVFSLKSISLAGLVLAGGISLSYRAAQDDHATRSAASPVDVAAAPRATTRRHGIGRQTVQVPAEAAFVPHGIGSASGGSGPHKVTGISSGFGYAPYQIYPVDEWLAESVAIGDFDADGRKDIALTTVSSGFSSDGMKVFIYLQADDGGLLAPIKVPYLGFAAQATGLTVGNIDNDDTTDIIVGHDRGITAIRGNRDRDFQPTPLPGWLRSTDVGLIDFNVDGRLDVLAQSWSDGAAIHLGDGRGGFAEPVPFNTSAFGYNHLSVGDVTGDGLPDMVLTQGQGFAYFWVYPNRWSGGIGPAIRYDLDTSRSRPWGNAIGDFDNDGRNDIALSIPENRPYSTVNLFMQGADGRLQAGRILPSYDIVEPLVAADLDSNGLADLATAHGGWNKFGVYLQDASGLRPEVLFDMPPTYTSHYESNGMAVGDINGDGCPDIVVADYANGLVVLRGKNCHPRVRIDSGSCRLENALSPNFAANSAPAADTTAVTPSLSAGITSIRRTAR